MRSNLRSRIRDYIRSEIRGYISGLNLNDYNFYCSFKEGAIPVDKVSKQFMQSTGLAAGRVSYHGGPYAVNEPAIDKYGLFGCPAFTVLNGKSNDVSDDYWDTDATLLITGTNEIQATAQGDRIRKTINTTAGTYYTLSFYARVEPGGKTSGYQMFHYLSDTSNTSALTLSETRERYYVTVLGAASGDVVSFGFSDNNTDSWSKIYIDTINVTEGSLLYPPVINDTTTALAIPENFSDTDQGYKFDTAGQLLDALDGEADGDELLVPVSSKSTSAITNKTETTFDFENTSGAAQGHLIFYIFTVGEYYEVSFNVEFTEPGQLDIYVGAENVSTITSDTKVTARAVCTTDGTLRFITRSLGVAGTVTVNHVKQISPAQGKLTVKWRPMFNSGDLTGSINILTANDEASSFLFFDADNDLLKLTDGTNTSQVACSPVADTEYEVTAQHDETNGMVISLDGTAGTTVPFAGKFPNADDLSFFHDAQAPQYVKTISIEKEEGWE